MANTRKTRKTRKSKSACGGTSRKKTRKRGSFIIKMRKQKTGRKK